MSTPSVLFCYYCGQQNPYAGFKFHFVECQKKWKNQDLKKPKNLQVKNLKQPQLLDLALGKQEGETITKKQMKLFNQQAKIIYQQYRLKQCQNCGRRFQQEKLIKHQKGCTPQNPLVKKTTFCKTIEKSQYQKQIQPFLERRQSKPKSFGISRANSMQSDLSQLEENKSAKGTLKKKPSLGESKIAKSSFVNQKQNMLFQQSDDQQIMKFKRELKKGKTLLEQPQTNLKKKTLMIAQRDMLKQKTYNKQNQIPKRGLTKPKTQTNKGRRRSKTLQPMEYDPQNYLPCGFQNYVDEVKTLEVR